MRGKGYFSLALKTHNVWALGGVEALLEPALVKKKINLPTMNLVLWRQQNLNEAPDQKEVHTCRTTALQYVFWHFVYNFHPSKHVALVELLLLLAKQDSLQLEVSIQFACKHCSHFDAWVPIEVTVLNEDNFIRALEILWATPKETGHNWNLFEFAETLFENMHFLFHKALLWLKVSKALKLNWVEIVTL